jgi:hypothetical protein
MARPLAMGWVRPNSIFGVRTRKTLRNERIWTRANAFFGRGMGLVAALGAALALAAPALGRVRPGLEWLLFAAAFLALFIASALQVAFAS